MTSSEDTCAAKWKHGTLTWMNSLQNPKAGVARGKFITVVHVGKTAGGTVIAMLSKALKTSDKHRIREIHLRPLEQSDLALSDTIVVGIRDPVERLLSAFYFHLNGELGQFPSNWQQRLYSQAQISEMTAFYECFHSFEEFAMGLLDKSACGAMARKGVGHLEWGLCYYMGGLQDELKTRKILLVDASSLIPDVNYILGTLNVTAVSDDNVPRVHAHPHPTELSDRALMILRGHLELTGEYSFHRKLYEWALNKDVESIL
jgi:hypothetical protein